MRSDQRSPTASTARATGQASSLMSLRRAMGFGKNGGVSARGAGSRALWTMGCILKPPACRANRTGRAGRAEHPKRTEHAGRVERSRIRASVRPCAAASKTPGAPPHAKNPS
ncbi:hypothetical protein BpKM390_30150 [Burkholderia pseudomallei]|nr:hypothetical protein TKS_28880 [Burkholderia pseudomallei]BEH61770.1 hypothetical protein BpKM390_30150 [Burkholderia pseudomallei]